MGEHMACVHSSVDMEHSSHSTKTQRKLIEMLNDLSASITVEQHQNQ